MLSFKWITATCCLDVMVLGFFYAFVILASDIEKFQGVDRSDMTWIECVTYLSALVPQFLVSLVVEIAGPKRSALLGLAVYGLSQWLLYVCYAFGPFGFGWLLAFYALTGLGLATTFVSVIAIVSENGRNKDYEEWARPVVLFTFASSGLLVASVYYAAGSWGRLEARLEWTQLIIASLTTAALLISCFVFTRPSFRFEYESLARVALSDNKHRGFEYEATQRRTMCSPRYGYGTIGRSSSPSLATGEEEEEEEERGESATMEQEDEEKRGEEGEREGEGGGDSSSSESGSESMRSASSMVSESNADDNEYDISEGGSEPYRSHRNRSSSTTTTTTTTTRDGDEEENSSNASSFIRDHIKTDLEHDESSNLSRVCVFYSIGMRRMLSSYHNWGFGFVTLVINGIVVATYCNLEEIVLIARYATSDEVPLYMLCFGASQLAGVVVAALSARLLKEYTQATYSMVLLVLLATAFCTVLAHHQHSLYFLVFGLGFCHGGFYVLLMNFCRWDRRGEIGEATFGQRWTFFSLFLIAGPPLFYVALNLFYDSQSKDLRRGTEGEWETTNESGCTGKDCFDRYAVFNLVVLVFTSVFVLLGCLIHKLRSKRDHA